MELKDLFISEDATVLQAMQQIDQSAKQMLLVTEGCKLKAIITDGDYRRHLLRGGNLEDHVRDLANYSPRYILEKDKVNAKEMMKNWSILSLPVVNEEMELQSVVFANDYEIGRSRSVGIPVVIMAGGEGSRLYPYTKVLPKPLIPVGEIPITEHIINQFMQYDCSDIHLIVNYRKNMIKAYFNEIKKNYTVQYHDEDKPLGTGGGLSLLKGIIRETFFFSNCDILINANYKEIYDFHKNNNNLITLVAAYKHFTIPYGVITMNGEGEIAAMTEKPQYSFLTNTGFYVVEPELVNRLEENIAIGFPEIIEAQKAKGEKIGIFPVSEKCWLDMGQLEELEQMRKEMGF
jgi:dTDP-glucose pyrophosphorylase